MEIMKAEELRLGNLVTIDNIKYWPELINIPMTVTQIKDFISNGFPESNKSITVCCFKKYGESFNQANEFISPIPLTEEWLLKFGFIKIDEKHNFFILGINPNLKIDKSLKWVAWCNTVLNNVKFDYVHQLQNLYFALTGEELNLKAS